MSISKEIYIEKLIEEYRRLEDLWDGKNLSTERKMDEIAGELEDLGVKIRN